MTTAKTLISSSPPDGQVRPVAVIDIGASAIRMAIAEIDDSGHVRPLDALSREVELGRDSFITRRISQGTIERCAEILRDYRRVIGEYLVADGDITVVATTAIREADNRLSVLDRMYMASGLKIRPIDAAEVHRLTYLAVLPLLESQPTLAVGDTLVIEVGGGTTDMILLEDGNVASSHSYRLGALRLPELLKALHAPAGTSRSLIESRVRRTVDRIRRGLRPGLSPRLVALGGDARFAANQQERDWRSSGICRISVERLGALVEDILRMSADELIARYRLASTEAETLGTALLTYLHLAVELGAGEIVVSTANLRDGMLMETAVGGTWTEAFRTQIERSAVELGRRFGFDEAHGLLTARHAQTLFRALREHHGMGDRFELLLRVAAMLHDVGAVVSSRSHHKHSMYLIRNSDLFGLGQRDLLLTSLIARYHRRAAPRPTHEGYATLDMESRITVTKLASILRIADSLDRSDDQRISDIECTVQDGRLVICASGVDDLSLEKLALRQKGTLFETVFGLTIDLRHTKP